MKGRVLHTVAMLLAACGSGARTPPDRSTDSTASTAAPANDSLALALSGGGGGEVWFTDSRPASDRGGRSCGERVLEIRRGGLRVPVPLLYTGEPPVQINDSTIQARLWQQCRPMARYNVDLRTGRPTRAP